MLKFGDDYVQIQSRQVFDFLRSHSENEAILQGFVENAEMFCRCTANFLEKCTSQDVAKNQVSSMISYFQDFEKRVLEKENHFLQMNSSTMERMVERISGQFVQLIGTIDTNVSKSLQVWDMNTLQSGIKHIVAQCITENNQVSQEQRHPIIVETLKTTCDLKNSTDRIQKSIDQLAFFQKDSKTRGEISEEILCNLLSERLREEEGYEVKRVGGKDRNCDILISNAKKKVPNVLVEVKNYGEFSNTRVPLHEVSKFQRDLISTNHHGIFVSLNSGIVGKGSLDIERLPNGKIATYISNNRYDADAIIGVLYFIYHFDKIIQDCEGDEDHERYELSTESFDKIRSFMQNFTEKISGAKTHMRQAIELLSNITFDTIEKIILGKDDVGDDGSPIETREKPHFCHICKNYFKSPQTIYNHQNGKCPRLKQTKRVRSTTAE